MGMINQKDKEYILSLKPEDITFELLLNLFGDSIKKDNNGKVSVINSRFKTWDEFDLKPNEYFNKEKVTTNIGLFIYNKYIIERNLVNILGYVNKTIDKKVLSEIENKLSKALLNDKISVDIMVNYLNDIQWLAQQFHIVISGSYTMKLFKPIPKVIDLKNKLIKENKEKLKQGDIITAVKIEKELIQLAEEELKDDTGYELYKSGARGTFSNNYKNTNIMKGPVYNPSTGEFDFVENCLMEGIKKEDLAVYGNAIITGAYPKAIGTADSGYFSKKIIAALQAVVLDEKGSDCGSKALMEVEITKENINDYIYRYIMERNKLILLDDDNINKYIGNKVKMRTPMGNVSKKLCRVCAGLMYEKLNITNIGLTSARVSSTLVNLSMKKFHNSTSQISRIELNNLIV